MSDSFSKAYLRLLSKQVDEEIHYLVQNGHENDKIYVPCMFCINRQNHYICGRLRTLRDFKVSIDSHEGQQRRVLNKRRRIGFETIAEQLQPRKLLLTNTPKEMPLLSVQL